MASAARTKLKVNRNELVEAIEAEFADRVSRHDVEVARRRGEHAEAVKQYAAAKAARPAALKRWRREVAAIVRDEGKVEYTERLYAPGNSVVVYGVPARPPAPQKPGDLNLPDAPRKPTRLLQQLRMSVEDVIQLTVDEYSSYLNW